jgi:hypothetical protein
MAVKAIFLPLPLFISNHRSRFKRFRFKVVNNNKVARKIDPGNFIKLYAYLTRTSVLEIEPRPLGSGRSLTRSGSIFIVCGATRHGA